MENVVKKDVLRASNEEANRITKECIQTALINLIAVKPFDKITITELVLKSGVSRMSFYRNYKSKEDVIIDMCTELEDQLTESIADDSFKKDPRSWYFELFSKVRAHEKEFTLLFSANMPQNITIRILSTAGGIFRRFPLSDEEKYKASAWEGALFGIIFHWLSEGMERSPEEMADMCMKLINNGI
ncbi:MAG: TetR/AcrR family transcriptional regulator [Oscillospiraceae bacterium]|nr:TetR/AcrR family transcriptional regulator [Oscillospiraceae bacterium]MDY2848267.1 TetR/AcrR family transcriptional regulator [Oscillospiraceae bacterium]